MQSDSTTSLPLRSLLCAPSCGDETHTVSAKVAAIATFTRDVNSGRPEPRISARDMCLPFGVHHQRRTRRLTAGTSTRHPFVLAGIDLRQSAAARAVGETPQGIGAV